MAILVTGGAGYTGAHVCMELLKQGHEVVIVDNFLTSSADRLQEIREETGKDFKLYAMDLGQEELVKRIFKENDIEGIIHFAGIKSTGAYAKDTIEYYYSNLASTLMLCKAMSTYNVKKMVFSSSEGFYGDNGAENKTYGAAKLMIERILQHVYDMDPTWGIKIIRYLKKEGNVYSKKDISAKQMCDLYIEAFKTIETGNFETYDLEIGNGTLIIKEVPKLSSYEVELL